MGSGIAVCLLSAGLPVYLLEQNEKVSPINGILSSCQSFKYAKGFFFYLSSIFAQTQLGMLYFVLSAVLMNDFLIANSPSFRVKEIKILFLSSTIGQGLFLAAGQVRQS